MHQIPKNFQITLYLKGFLLGLITSLLFLGLSLLLAWTEPTEVPPSGNVPTPINVGSTFQTKTGSLAVTTLYDTDDPTGTYYVNPSGPISGIFSGKVGIGTTTPTSLLEVAGEIKSATTTTQDIVVKNQMCLGGICRSEWPSSVGGCKIQGQRYSDETWVDITDAMYFDGTCVLDWNRNCYKKEIFSGYQKPVVTKNGDPIGCVKINRPSVPGEGWDGRGYLSCDISDPESLARNYCRCCHNKSLLDYYCESLTGETCDSILASQCFCGSGIQFHEGWTMQIAGVLCCDLNASYSNLRVRCGNNYYYY